MNPPPIDLTPSTVADWLEMCLLTADAEAEGDLRFSFADMTDAMEEAGVEDTDAHLANLRAEVQRRQRVMGNRYPIERRNRGFEARGPWDDYLSYTFLLLVSLNQLYPELRFVGGAANVPAELFENLAGSALTSYVGGRTIRIGAPRRNPTPAAFSKAVRYVSAELAETLGYGELEDQNSGDDGVDLVVWKGFSDARESQLIILAQCAIGTDWRDKRSELDLSVWREHIRWATMPLKAFAVPFQHELGGSWRETAVRGGIVLDRGRIVSCLPDDPVPVAVLNRMRTWCRGRITAIRNLTS